MFAAGNDHLDVVRVLLDNGANREARDRDGETPLAYAARFGSHRICSLLIEKGANVDTRDEDGTTPLMLAAREGHVDVVRLLLDHGATGAATARERSLVVFSTPLLLLNLSVTPLSSLPPGGDVWMLSRRSFRGKHTGT